MPSTVLIIDAEEPFAHDLGRSLEARGVQATVTGDGKQGLELAQRLNPSAIVLCVELPRMSGYSICGKLRKDDVLKSVPLVITSSAGTDEIFEYHKKLKTRAEAYLRKPFAVDVLVEALAPYATLGDNVPATADALQEEFFIREDELVIDGEPPQTLSDDEAFSKEEASSIAQAGARTGDILGALSEVDSASDDDAAALSRGAALSPEEEEEDEVMTTIGAPPATKPIADARDRELAELRSRLDAERDTRHRAERERDAAIANEKAASAKAETLASSQPPSAATGSSGGREVLALKKELNAKQREVLELKEKLTSLEKELLAERDRQMELEGNILQAEERAEETERARVDIAGKLAASEARAAEVARSSERSIAELNRQLTEARGRGDELETALATTTSEKDKLARELQTRGDAIELLRRERARLENEVAAAAAEATTLREQLSDARATIETRDGEISALARERDALRLRLDAAVVESKERSESLDAATKRLADADAAKAKAKKAIEIALALLDEADYATGVAVPSDGEAWNDDDAAVAPDESLDSDAI